MKKEERQKERKKEERKNNQGWPRLWQYLFLQNLQIKIPTPYTNLAMHLHKPNAYICGFLFMFWFVVFSNILN